jgi:SAM-dependent methyltransferase
VKRCQSCGHGFAGEGWSCPRCGWAPARRDGVLSFAPELVEGVGAEGGFEAEAFERLARLEEGSFWFHARNRLIMWALDTYAPRARSFLEIGCGTGFVLAAVARARPDIRLTGSELFTAGLRHAVERVPSAELVQMDARQIPYEDEFDAIGGFDVLEHVDDDSRVLSECHRALRPGGTLLLTVPQHPRLWSAADDYAHHLRRYTRPRLVASLNRAGLETVRITSFVSALLPLMAASRVIERRSSRSYDPAAEHQRSAHLRRPLAAVMRAEAALIRRGVSFPAGGSLLAVAVRR